MAIPQGFRNVLGIATPVCGLVRNDRGVPKQTDKSEFAFVAFAKMEEGRNTFILHIDGLSCIINEIK